MIAVLTHSGSRVNILDPDPGTISVHDIAFHLSNINRYTGATTWSVAAHSVLALRMASEFRVPTYYLLWAMLHDAHEAYTGDITTPMKMVLGMDRITAIQNNLDRVIRKALGIERHHSENAERFAAQIDVMANAVESALFLSDSSGLEELGCGIPTELVEEIRAAEGRTPKQWRDRFIGHYVELLETILEHKAPEVML